MAKHLTERLIKTTKAPTQGYLIIWDDEVKGFGLRITANGAAAYIFNYRTSTRRQRRITYPAHSVEAARKKAKRYEVEVEEGRDPLYAREIEREAPTVADLCQLYLDTHAKSKRPVPAKTDRYTIEREILPAMQHLTVAEVKYSHVAKLHRQITERAPYRANRVLALLTTLFNVAFKEGMRADNPTKGVKRNTETPRERYLSGAELARLLSALRDHADQDEANAVRLLMLTGARRGEVLSMQWEDLNFEKGTWTKPSHHTKTKKTHTIPLSAPALQLLADMRASATSQHVFPGPGKSGHRADLKKPWAAICKAAGIGGLRLHDLRHSYASTLASEGLSLAIIGALLGHTQPATTARYAHLVDAALRKATERVGDVLAGAGSPGTEVVKLRNR